MARIKKPQKIDCIIGIDIADFISSTADWEAADLGRLMQELCSLVSTRSWFEIKKPFYVLRKGTAARPSITVRDRIDVLRVGKCAHCGATKFLTVDHIVPLARGGEHVRHNFQCLCWTCNRKKGVRLEAELG